MQGESGRQSLTTLHHSISRLGLFARLKVLGQALKPDDQRRVAFNLNRLVLNAGHESQLLVLGLHRGKAIISVFEGNGESRLGVQTRMAGDAKVFDFEVTGHFAIEGLQLENQVFINQLLLESRVFTAGSAQNEISCARLGK